MKEQSIYDAAMVVGVGSLDYGLWLAWHPLGFIVGGAILGVGAFFLGYGKSRLRSASK